MGDRLDFTSDVTDLSRNDLLTGFRYAWSVLKDGQPYPLPPEVDVGAPAVGFTPTEAGSYEVRLYAWDKDGDRSPLATKTVVVNAIVPVVPIPRGLQAAVAGPTQVNLDWSDAADQETTYNIYRGTTADFTPGATNLLTAQTIGDSQYVDEVPAAGIYYYKIMAVLGGVTSAAVATTAQDTTVSPLTPLAPSSVTATWAANANDGSGGIVLTWVDNSLNESGFTILRTNPDGTQTTLSAPTNSTDLTDTNPFSGVADSNDSTSSVVYVVPSVNSGGTSAASQPSNAVATQPSNVNLPALSVTQNATFDTATISWNGQNDSGFTVEKLVRTVFNGISKVGWQIISEVGGTVNSVQVTIEHGHIYSFRVYGPGVEPSKAIPVRIYTGPATDDKSKAFKYLSDIEAIHKGQPYYVNGTVQYFFNQEFVRLDEIKAIEDATLVDPAVYKGSPSGDNANTFIIFNPGFANVPLTIVHELVHGMDDLNNYNLLTLNTRAAEGVAYACEHIIYRLGVDGLSELTTKAFKTKQEVQIAWNQAWRRLNNLAATPIQYYYGPLKQTGTVEREDRDNARSQMSLRLSASDLLPIYNSYLATKGFGQDAINNNALASLITEFA